MDCVMPYSRQRTKMTEYIGFFGDYCYTPTANDYGMGPGWPRARVYKCPCCKIRWFRRVTEDMYDGLCWVCFREEFEGEPDLPF